MKLSLRLLLATSTSDAARRLWHTVYFNERLLQEAELLGEHAEGNAATVAAATPAGKELDEAALDTGCTIAEPNAVVTGRK